MSGFFQLLDEGCETLCDRITYTNTPEVKTTIYELMNLREHSLSLPFLNVYKFVLCLVSFVV